MNRFKNLQVATKLLVAFSLVLALIVALGSVAVFDFANMARNTQDITGNWMPSIARLGQINGYVANFRIQQLRIATARAPEEAQSHLREAQGLLETIEPARREYEKYISGEEERALWKEYSAQWQAYLDLHARMLALAKDHKQSEALDLIGGEGKRLYDAAASALDRDLKLNTRGAEVATAASTSIYRTARLLVVAVVIAAMVLSGIIALGLSRSIRAPLERIITVFRSMASGKLDNPIDTSRHDEIGLVLRGLDDMQNEMRKLVAENRGQLEAIGKAQAVIEFDLEGNVTCANHNFLQTLGYSLEEIRGRHHSLFVTPADHASDGYRQFWEKLRRGEYDKGRYMRLGKNHREVWIDASYNPILDAEGKPYKVVKYANDVTAQVLAARQMDQAVTQTQAVVKAATEGNLMVRVASGEMTGDLRKMSESINALLANMADIVGKVKQASEEVYRGAEEISQGNINLSQRTEEQASSLEETASSMEQMTSTVKQNADNAAQASQLAMAARDQAEKGGTITGRAVHAMAEINEASRKIAAIIGVIDDIAFQTNLLALNAAVEAARAGEQGRGFAVVASEVRSLAGRSATAAKEIKDLIQDSVKKVGDGSVLVTQSGETLGVIVNSVKKVSDIVAEIAAASREQSGGIDQVNKAVTQMDQMTQQNAALVEQATAASQSVTDQARTLNSVIAVYHLEESAEPAPGRRSAGADLRTAA
jgi:methyl-accepting chemotaxis protein